MSFGVGFGDLAKAIELVKTTATNIKTAPHDFKQGEKTVQNLKILLESVGTELESPTSVFRRDESQTEQLNTLVQSCHPPLTRLNKILQQFQSLGTNDKRFLDRARFSKKVVLEIRGELALRHHSLSTFLEFIGVGGIGRIENKVNKIRNVQTCTRQIRGRGKVGLKVGFLPVGSQ